MDVIIHFYDIRSNENMDLYMPRATKDYKSYIAI